MPEVQPPFNPTGKRFVCAVCGAEVIVTRGSQAQQQPLSCDGQPMQAK